MTRSTKLLNNERVQSWGIFYGDVQVGTIFKRSGNPVGTDPWQWSCGFYPGCLPGEQQTDTAATFDEARAAFQAAWEILLPKKTEADFEEWRAQRKWTAEKYARWESGWRPPPYNGIMECACGVKFNERDPAQSRTHVPHITVAQKAGTYAKSGRALHKAS